MKKKWTIVACPAGTARASLHIEPVRAAREARPGGRKPGVSLDRRAGEPIPSQVPVAPIPTSTNGAPSAQAERRSLVLLVSLCSGLPAVAAALGAAVRPAEFPGALAAALVAGCVAGMLSARRAGPRWAPWLLAAATLCLVVVGTEVGLRWAGFRFDPTGVMQFGYPRPDQMFRFDPDPDLFWKLPTDRPTVNRLGFGGPAPTIPKPSGTWRMVFFGDSCTFQGFPSLVSESLRARVRTPLRVDHANLSVPGYSSYQGRILVDRWADELEPDLAVIYFGWNDHWRAYGATDAEKGRALIRPYVPLAPVVAASRLAQAVVWIASEQTPRLQSTLRVPIDEYAANLQAMGDRIGASGGEVLLVTAPTSYYRLGVPVRPIKTKKAESRKKLIELHRSYNDVVREVAASNGWHLLDLERIANAHPNPEAIFGKDGVHFTDEGLAWIAEQIVAYVAERVLPAGGDEPAGRIAPPGSRAAPERLGFTSAASGLRSFSIGGSPGPPPPPSRHHRGLFLSLRGQGL